MTVFEKIVTGEIPSFKIAETKDYLAFLDVCPLKEGHALVIPKIPIDYIFNLDDDVLAGLHLFAKKVANAIKEVVPCARIGMAVIGLEVPHVHIHLVPIVKVGDMDFSSPKIPSSSDKLRLLADEIAQAYKG